MDINITQIRAFLSVARFKSFTQAATLLHISQPALTMQIRQLEESLGLRLFDRDTRHVQLTSSGSELLPKLQHLLSEFEAIVTNARDIATNDCGVVRVGCVPSIAITCLPDAIARFRERHPHISFQVQDELSRQITAMVQSDVIEFGVINGDPNSPDLDVADFYSDDIQVVFQKSHPLARLRKIKLDDIPEYPIVFLNVGLNLRRVLDEAFAARNRLVKPVCEVTFPATAIAMVRAGLGIALLGSLIIKANNLQSFPELRSRRIDDFSLVRHIKIIQKKGRSLSPPAQEFKDVLLELIKNNHSTNGSEPPRTRASGASNGTAVKPKKASRAARFSAAR